MSEEYQYQLNMVAELHSKSLRQYRCCSTSHHQLEYRRQVPRRSSVPSLYKRSTKLQVHSRDIQKPCGKTIMLQPHKSLEKCTGIRKVGRASYNRFPNEVVFVRNESSVATNSWPNLVPFVICVPLEKTNAPLPQSYVCELAHKLRDSCDAYFHLTSQARLRRNRSRL